MTFQVKEKKVLISLMIRSGSDWRTDISKLSSLGITELALFIDSSLLEQRKEVYRLLEGSGLKSIPYVQISNNFEEGELDYLVTTYGTLAFGLSLDNSSLAFITTLTKFAGLIAPENPVDNKYTALFTDDALSHANINGVCLNATTLEYDRLYHKKKYQSEIHALDHHPLMATKIGPISENFIKQKLRLHSSRLTTLSDLHYLKNVQKSYLADLLVLDFKNTLEEQLEIKAYLELMYK